MCRLARYRLSEGRPEEAARLAERALLAMSPRASSDKRYVQALGIAADALETLGRYREARPLREDAVALGADAASVVTVTACLQLGNLLRILAEYRQAEPLLARAVEAANRSNDGRLQAGACNALGVLCKETGRYEEAECHYQRARTLLEASGLDPSALASVWHNLAGLAYARGLHADGERAAQLAIETRHSAVGPDTPEVAADLAVLAVLVATQGRLDEAEVLYQRALAIFRRAYGPDHYEVAVNLNGLAALRQQRDDHRGAEQLQLAALSIKERTLGADHPEVATLLNNLALSLARQDRRREATVCHQRALRIFDGALGPDHPSTVACRDNYARLLGDTGGERDPKETQSRLPIGRL